MLRYGYYILAVAYILLLIYSLYMYLSRPAPTGDATVDWAWGIIYSIGIFVILVIGLLLWKKPNIGFFVLCIPLLFFLYPIIRAKMTDLYAVAPSLNKVPPLTLTIQNTTKATVHVQLSCWFSTGDKGTSSLYRTMDYTLEPLKTNDYTFSDYETNLLANKSKFITVMMYEHVKMSYNGEAYEKEIQPCMQYYDEQIEAFGKGTYTIVIDSTKNTPTFKEEVEHMKQTDGYGSGVF